jgi:hypothetical protein
MTSEAPPEWPQPQGIFEKGKTFHPMAFLTTIHDVFEKLVIEKSDGDDLLMEYEAFVRLLQNRTIIHPDRHCLFKLFDLQLPKSTPVGIIVEYNGCRYLRLDCLRDDNEVASGIQADTANVNPKPSF